MNFRAISCARMAIATIGVLASIFGASASAEPKTVEVVIERFAFMPASIEVRPGDTVVFTNRDIVPHTATSLDGSWTTKDIPRGGSEALVVPANGSGTYDCRYHPAMKGRLVIAPAS